jgi:hypothetical protein
VSGERILAWHFLPEDGRMTHRRGRPLIVAGAVHSVRGELELCARGLHGSRRAIDALGYAPGPIVQRVEHFGKIIEGSDKLCSSRRRCLAIADASRVLREFACDQAESALRLSECNDERSWRAVSVSRLYAVGEASADELAAAGTAAWDAARAAAGAAAGAAAWDAARAAAWAAARAAAWAAAWAAAGTAAGTAAWDAARAAAWDAANLDLSRRLLLLLNLEPTP